LLVEVEGDDSTTIIRPTYADDLHALYWILTVVLSILIYKYFEIPIMNLRERIKVN